MRIAKPLLLTTTPIGLVEGFYECYRWAGGLMLLMAAMVGVFGLGMAWVWRTVRREARRGGVGSERAGPPGGS